MSFSLAMAIMLAQGGTTDTWGQFDRVVSPKVAPAAPGPHTLVVMTPSVITRFDYTSGTLCQRARAVIGEQQPNLITFCVPR